MLHPQIVAYPVGPRGADGQCHHKGRAVNIPAQRCRMRVPRAGTVQEAMKKSMGLQRLSASAASSRRISGRCQDFTGMRALGGDAGS